MRGGSQNASLADKIKAEAIAGGLGEMFGKKPMVYESGGRMVVGLAGHEYQPTPGDIKRAQARS